MVLFNKFLKILPYIIVRQLAKYFPSSDITYNIYFPELYDVNKYDIVETNAQAWFNDLILFSSTKLNLLERKQILESELKQVEKQLEKSI